MPFHNSLFLVLLLLTCSLAAQAQPNCVGCHSQAVSGWQQSDHAKAMAPATDTSVLGDFSGQVVSHHSQTAKFFRRDKAFIIQFAEADKTTEYKVSYTFGHYPLQEYLIEGESGRYQVFPFAWDSRPQEQGGQRWYPIYPDEDVQPADRLHWQQPLQNWNGMCADCHSDGLKRNYSAADNSFDSQWDNINVGCQSCHGEMNVEHGRKPDPDDLDLNQENQEEPRQPGQWRLKEGENVAHWQGDKRDNSFMDSCFSCHSLRSPLTDGFKPDVPFLDQFSPNLLAQPFYYPDGQIHDEVYVYGSFLQSKMYRAGVNCLDCHDTHTMKVKVDNNGLCLQCHNSETYQTTKHTHHPLDSDAGQCVNCHMPETTYMGVDGRRDHSFRIPRPELTRDYKIPNACNGCHEDKSSDWAVAKVTEAFGNDNPLSRNEQAYIQLQHQYYLPAQEHLAVIQDTSLNEIYRASAIALLPNSVRQLTDRDIKDWVNSPLPLIRLATAQVGHLLPRKDRRKTYSKLLGDKYKAIRIQAASQMLDLGITHSAHMKTAYQELMTSHNVNLWRGEGGLNLSMVQVSLGQLQPAIQSLKHAISVDPYFDAAYVNLADIYRSNQAVDQEKALLEQGLEAIPASGVLHYSYALHQIRSDQKQAAVASLAKAMKLEPRNPQYAYVYFVALDSLGQTRQALAKLNKVISEYNNNPQLLELGLSLARKLNDNSSYQKLMNLYR